MEFFGIYFILIGLVALGFFITRVYNAIADYKESKDRWIISMLPLEFIFLAISFLSIATGIYIML